MTECVTDFLAVSQVELNVTQSNVCGTRRSENETIYACLGHRTSCTFVGLYPVTLKWRLVTRMLVLGQGGTAKGRVLRNFPSLEAAKVHQQRHPNLVVVNQPTSRPRQQGDVVDMKLRPRPIERVGEDR